VTDSGCLSVCLLSLYNQNGWKYNHQTCHRDSPSRVLTIHLILGQIGKDQGHRVTKCKNILKAIEWPAWGMHSIEYPASSWFYFTFKCLDVELSAVRCDITSGKSRYGNTRVFIDTPTVAGRGVALCSKVEWRSTLAYWNEDVTFRVISVQLDSSWSRLGASTPNCVAASCCCCCNVHQQRNATAQCQSVKCFTCSRKKNYRWSTGLDQKLKLEGTHRVRSHADNWLRHLANVHESRF